jgi:GGDEF domain-containing protein
MAKKIKNSVDMDKLYSDLMTFKARVQEELRRAKRYATFVSMVSMDLSRVEGAGDIDNYKSYDDFIMSLRKLLRGSIRESDILSISEKHRVLILLMDTPREGALALVDRLAKTLRYFMANNIKSPLNWRVPMKEYSFPTSSTDDYGIQTFLDKIGD